LTRGLYKVLDDEAQLAGVLGHEIGHIVRRHHITVMQQSAAVSAGAKIAQRGDQSYLVNNLIGSGAEVFARSLDKDAEFEADRVGLVLAARRLQPLCPDRGAAQTGGAGRGGPGARAAVRDASGAG